MKTSFKFSLLSFLILTCYGVFGQALTAEQIDSLVQKTMETFEVPGMAVAVVKDGEVVVKKGYGVSSLETGKAVDENTIFGIASNTKAFTTAAIAQLVDEGQLDWDTKVTDVIPEFKLYDYYVTSEFTIRDLLTHRSGLGLGAGDLMLWPTSNTTTLEEMIHNLRYLKPVSSFRSKYDYDNLLYIVAGEVVARASGMDFEEYVAKNIFTPLQMNRATMDLAKIGEDSNRISGHSKIDGELQALTRNSFSEITKAAGGIFASIDDMTKWIQARLANGQYGENKENRLFSLKQAKEMWTPQTIMRTGPEDYNTHFKAYGLGWRLQDACGYLQVWHTGALSGMVSKTTLIPELDLGIVVLTNQGVGAAYNAMTNTILDGYFGIENKDRINSYQQSRLASMKRAEAVDKEVENQLSKNLKNRNSALPDESVHGAYNDDWFGKVNIERSNGKLHFQSEKSPDLKGEMQFYKGTTYVVRWTDRSIKADAFINFQLDTDGKAEGFKMEAISPLTDFSYDFQDLDFKRID